MRHPLHATAGRSALLAAGPLLIERLSVKDNPAELRGRVSSHPFA